MDITPDIVLDAALDKMLDECLLVWEITTRDIDPDDEVIHYERFE